MQQGFELGRAAGAHCPLFCAVLAMPALGHKRTSKLVRAMSALPPKADVS
jgi:hypothetical protein